jgi:hypothetical protein
VNTAQNTATSTAPTAAAKQKKYVGIFSGDTLVKVVRTFSDDEEQEKVDEFKAYGYTVKAGLIVRQEDKLIWIAKGVRDREISRKGHVVLEGMMKEPEADTNGNKH